MNSPEDIRLYFKWSEEDDTVVVKIFHDKEWHDLVRINEGEDPYSLNYRELVNEFRRRKD